MSDCKPRPIVRSFTELMEMRLRIGDERDWVWNENAAMMADGEDLVSRAVKNLLAARRAWALGEAEAAEESFADAANLAMFAYSSMCAHAKSVGGLLWAGPDDIFDGAPREDARRESTDA